MSKPSPENSNKKRLKRNHERKLLHTLSDKLFNLRKAKTKLRVMSKEENQKMMSQRNK